MLVSDDKDINKETLKGFYLFLFSESLRHAQDIKDIAERMKETSNRIGLTRAEEQYLEIEALKFVKF